MSIITRRDAQLRGHKRYSTGRPCNQGHLSERYVTTGACVQCLALNNERYRTGFVRRRLLLDLPLPPDYPYGAEDELRAALVSHAQPLIAATVAALRPTIESPDAALLREWESLGSLKPGDRVNFPAGVLLPDADYIDKK